MSTLKKLAVAAGAALMLGSGSLMADQSVTLFNPGTSGIDPGSFAVVINNSTNTVTLRETWTSTAPSFIQFSGFSGSGTWTVNKLITNNSGSAWNRFANELLDPLGTVNNDGSDPLPYPAFVPPGFSTSNDSDGLSFAQGSSRPRTSSVFGSVFADELTNRRDFIDFYNGLLVTGGVDDVMTFSVINASAENIFLLAQRPNESSTVIPVPAGLPLMASGLVALGVFTRRRKA